MAVSVQSCGDLSQQILSACVGVIFPSLNLVPFCVNLKGVLEGGKKGGKKSLSPLGTFCNGSYARFLEGKWGRLVH